MNLVYAKNPKWVTRDQTLIDLTVRFEEIPEDLPFTADPNDSAEHGRNIHARALAGEFGVIADFNVAPPTVDEVSDAIKTERNDRIALTDWTQLPDIPQATRDLWEPYRQALRNIPQQSGFPWYNQVVVETNLGYEIDLSNAPWPQTP